MAPTAHECKCGWDALQSIDRVVTKKDYVRYRLGEFPFTTARKINHDMCATCGGLHNADLNKELTDDMCKNRAFIAEQDRMYSVKDDSPITPLKGYVQPETLFDNDWHDKQWHTGFIHYLRYLQTADSIKIVPSSKEYLVYCNEAEKLSIAAKQFVKPDDYFKLTSIV